MKTAHLLGLFLLASCSAEMGAQTPPSPIADGGSDASADASAEPPPKDEDGGTGDASVDRASDRSIWDDERVWPGYDGSNEPMTGNWLDAPRGPDGECTLHPNWAFYVTYDPVTGVVSCPDPPGTWQRAVCECVIERGIFPDASYNPDVYDRDR